MLKPSLQLKLTQQLTMTPQLQQAIRLLQLPIMELQIQIQQALDENVMLEAEEPEAPAETQDNGPDADEPDNGADPEEFVEPEREVAQEAEVAVASEADWQDVQKTGPADAPKSAEPPTTFEYADRSEETLRDHLLWQLELENLDSRTTAIGQAIIDAVNDDGYLTDDLDTIRATLAPDVVVTVEEVAKVLVELVQQFDPAGIGARNVSECVLLQLAQLAPDTVGLALARTIATEHLALIAERQFGQLKRLLKVSDAELESAIALVRSTHPRPGSAVFAPASDYIVPDVFVRRSDGQWIVELNNAVSPQLRVNQVYAGSRSRSQSCNAKKNSSSSAKSTCARWCCATSPRRSRCTNRPFLG
jgi:RNA polymerase sigma-54 factor